MLDPVIAVLPSAFDWNVVQDGLRGEDTRLNLVRSTEQALVLLGECGSSAVILYDADTGQPWRDAVQRFLRASPGSRIVLLTQSADQRMWMDLFDSGAYDLLLRPLRPFDLRSIVRSALRPAKYLCSAA